MTIEVRPAGVNVETLRCQISDKYTEVAKTPEKGFHFHTGKPLARMLGYSDEVVDTLPVGTVEIVRRHRQSVLDGGTARRRGGARYRLRSWVRQLDRSSSSWGERPRYLGRYDAGHAGQGRGRRPRSGDRQHRVPGGLG